LLGSSISFTHRVSYPSELKVLNQATKSSNNGPTSSTGLQQAFRVQVMLKGATVASDDEGMMLKNTTTQLE
jgi:hypothetical protein